MDYIRINLFIHLLCAGFAAIVLSFLEFLILTPLSGFNFARIGSGESQSWQDGEKLIAAGSCMTRGSMEGAQPFTRNTPGGVIK
jgi:hypothetical protein